MSYSSFATDILQLPASASSISDSTLAEFVFTHFNTDNGAGIRSNLYIFVLGLLMSQYTLTGYDASAHMVRTHQTTE